MIKAKPKDRTSGPIDPAKLKGYVERIEAVEAEEADYKATKKDLYVEVKAAGLRPKMVRKLVKERKKTEADKEDEAELELYRAALAMPGATFRSVAKDLGVPRSTLHRLVPRNKNGTSAPKPEDGDDGITESNVSQAAPKDCLPCRTASDTDEAGFADLSNAASTPVLDGGVEAGPHSDEAPAPRSVGAVAAASPRVAPNNPDDDLAIPAHLRGPSPANRRVGA